MISCRDSGPEYSAYPLGPRFAGPRQGLAGGCAPFDPREARAPAERVVMADRRTVIAAARVSPTELARPITDLPHLPAQSADAFLHLLMQGAKAHEEQAGEGGSPAFEGIRQAQRLSPRRKNPARP